MAGIHNLNGVGVCVELGLVSPVSGDGQCSPCIHLGSNHIGRRDETIPIDGRLQLYDSRAAKDGDHSNDKNDLDDGEAGFAVPEPRATPVGGDHR